MPTRLNPYLTFDGDARQALEFYQGIFGGELAVNTFAEMGMPEGPDADKIMHGMIESGSLTLMAADNPPGNDYRRGNDLAVSLSGEDGDTLRGWWGQLSDGGNVMVPMEKQMWGDEFGMCEDRFGVTWMVNITQPG